MEGDGGAAGNKNFFQRFDAQKMISRAANHVYMSVNMVANYIIIAWR